MRVISRRKLIEYRSAKSELESLWLSVDGYRELLGLLAAEVSRRNADEAPRHNSRYALGWEYDFSKFLGRKREE